MGKWKKVKENQIYKNKWISLNNDDVVRPDGEPGQYSVLVTSDTVSVLVKDKDDKFLLVYLHRYPTDNDNWEVIKARQDGEEPFVTAKRELGEEMGLSANKWTKLGIFNPLNGLVRELNTVFLAEDIVPIDIEKEEQEKEGITEVKSFTLEEINHMIETSEIKDGFTIVAFHKYKLYLEKNNG